MVDGALEKLSSEIEANLASVDMRPFQKEGKRKQKESKGNSRTTKKVRLGLLEGWREGDDDADEWTDKP